MSVSVYQCFIFVHLGLRSILVLFEKAEMGEDGVLVNAYEIFNDAIPRVVMSSSSFNYGKKIKNRP